VATSGSNLTEDVSLAKVTEEVADSVFFSHCCRVEGAPVVELILDISVDPKLQCTLAVGAWKRLCINIIGNALKYTAKGYVMVSLKIGPTKKKGRPVAILTVADSGCGMSQEFLENRLFKAFSQENELANGTGLGMSLVAKLLRGFGGKIKVQSAKNSGTVMTVSMP
jgi:signal transduction histidine kinase